MSALYEALCWGCNICTFNNPLDAGQCVMCNNPRPQVQYDNLLAIREEARRQKIVQEEQDRQFAMQSNANSIKYQSVMDTNNNNDDDEQETAKQLLEANNDEDWNADDFKDDDDADWGDNEPSKDDIQMDDDEEYEDGDEYEDCDDDKEEYDGWGDADVTQQTLDIELKIPQKKQLFEILNPYKLHEFQTEFMKEIGEELYISDLQDIGILCRYYRWNRDEIMDAYLLDCDAVLPRCGLISSNKSKTPPSKTGKFDCWLCITTYDDCSTSTFYPLQCGHQFCNECWSSYLVSQMEKGPRCVMTKCIETSCKLTLRPSVFIKFLPYKYRIKFEEYLLHSFVSGLNNLKWCPGNECLNAVKADCGTPVSVHCPSCNYLWCFSCVMTSHLPCNCELARKWMKLHSTDSENITWVRAYTKECPKCRNHIEKNQGCNHMTCRCGYEFCWLCRRDWKKIGYGHTCNKPQHVVDEEDQQKTAQSYLKRYMFYFARYEAHEKSAQIATKSIKNAKECMRSYIIEGHQYDTVKQYKYSDLQFIEDAIKEIIECRQILQWSYCYGYYLADGCNLKELFETQQGLLESFCDNLHEKAEKKVDDKSQWFTLSDIKFRTELINLTKTAKKYRTNLCEALLSDDDTLQFIFQKGIK